jgi:ribosomal protein S18 acetylase RimI-like enzyme
MDGVTIRTFRPAEWRSYRDLRLRALEDSPNAFSTTYAEASARSDEYWMSRLIQLSADTDRLLVAERNGQRCGMAWGRLQPSEENTAQVFQMWVAPEHRGFGIGRMLLEAIIDWARQHGAVSIVLGVTCGNEPAWRLYESSGFKAYGELDALRSGSELKVQSMKLGISRDAA